MSQGPLCPNLTQKVQKEVSQMANRKLSCAMLYRWFKCKLKPPKKVHLFRSCEPLIKNFPVFALDPIRPYLDLSPERIFDLLTHLRPFQI